MNRPSKQDFYIGENQILKHYDKIGHIKALNKYADYLETIIDELKKQLYDNI